jgi:hypothetical protein
MFDVNDFEETLPGTGRWDVKRLAVSFETARRERGFAPAQRRGIVTAGVADTGFGCGCGRQPRLGTSMSGMPTSRWGRC